MNDVADGVDQDQTAQNVLSDIESTSFVTLSLLLHMPNLGPSNSAANKDMMSKIGTNGDTINLFSRKHCGKRRNCSLRAISHFPIQKLSSVDESKWVSEE